jgi:hypothetical protein
LAGFWLVVWSFFFFFFFLNFFALKKKKKKKSACGFISHFDLTMRFTLLWVETVKYFRFFLLACHSLMDTKTCFLTPRLQNPSCLCSVHSILLACRQCWNNMTSWTLSNVKLSRLCPTIKRSKS